MYLHILSYLEDTLVYSCRNGIQPRPRLFLPPSSPLIPIFKNQTGVRIKSTECRRNLGQGSEKATVRLPALHDVHATVCTLAYLREVPGVVQMLRAFCAVHIAPSRMGGRMGRRVLIVRWGWGKVDADDPKLGMWGDQWMDVGGACPCELGIVWGRTCWT